VRENASTLDSLRQDVFFASSSPSQSSEHAMRVLILALGIGANTAMFSRQFRARPSAAVP